MLEYLKGLTSLVYNFFDKESKDGGVNNEIKQNDRLAKELHRSIVKNFKRRKAYLSFKDNIWGADLADNK